MESRMQTTVRSTSKACEGLFTPREIALALGIKLDYYAGDVARSEAALHQEIATNQAAHDVPITAWSTEPDFFTSRHAYVRVLQREDVVASGQDVSLLFTGVTSTPATASDPSNGPEPKALAAFAKKHGKGVRHHAQLTKLLEANTSA
eukprot:1984740-Amphidinium_carterae.2